jgi:hypothetical protein
MIGFGLVIVLLEYVSDVPTSPSFLKCASTWISRLRRSTEVPFVESSLVVMFRSSACKIMVDSYFDSSRVVNEAHVRSWKIRVHGS